LGILSNLLGPKDGRSHGNDRPAIIRTATPEEIEPAIRLVLGGASVQVSEQHVQDFLTYARSREIDLGGVWVAEQDGKIAQAVLPVVSPGRTVLLLAPPFVSAGPGEHLLKRLAETACRAAAQKGIHLAQALIDPQEEALKRAYTASGFASMADLIYLQTDVRSDAAAPSLSPDDRWETYSDRMHALFARTIQATYQHSLDCPALNGMRDMEDVLLGHKASGEFDPEMWFVLTRWGEPLGVLLLAVSGRNDIVELTPEARGRNLGEVLMRQALAVAARQKRPRLTLAVDAKNIPAQKLYFRHGMSRLATKHAMMCDLRKVL